jgi:hypothetical protein
VPRVRRRSAEDSERGRWGAAPPDPAAKTGKVVGPARGQTIKMAEGDGLGEGEDRLELVEDLPALLCPAAAAVGSAPFSAIGPNGVMIASAPACCDSRRRRDETIAR